MQNIMSSMMSTVVYIIIAVEKVRNIILKVIKKYIIIYFNNNIYI